MRPTIFLSHSTAEGAKANALKRLIEEAFGGVVEIYVCADPESLEPDSRWLDTITIKLNKAVLMLVLASPAAVARPWVNFEVGAAWIRRIPIILVCQSEWPNLETSPLNQFDRIDPTDNAGLSRLLHVVARHVQLGEPIDSSD